MAARENQGMQIWLIVFAVLWVISTGLAIWFNMKWSETSKQIAAAETKQGEASKDAQQAQNENKRLKAILGYGEKEDLSAIDAEFVKDMEKYGVNRALLGADDVSKKSYRLLVKSQDSRIRIQESDLDDKTKSAAQAQQELAVAQENHKKRVAELDAALVKAKGDVAVADDMRKDLVNKAETARGSIANNLARKQEEVGGLKTDLKDKETQFNKTLSNTQAALDRAKDKIGELEEVNFEIEDGRIVSVNQRVGVVWINVGSADGLRPKMTFKVFSVDENDAHLSESKGSIEVTRILRDHWAEARITHDDSLDPILPQDKIYSPLWAPGRHEHVALAGLIDIDGDGQSDLEQMKQIIAVNGGVIDAEMLEDGTTKGEITLNTRFLISGEEKEITATGDRLTDPSNEKKTTASGELEARARRLGVTSIPVDKFLDHIGWRPAERTVGLGEHASGVQFPPRPPVKADPSSSRTITTPSFKRRSPPINGNGSLEQRG